MNDRAQSEEGKGLPKEKSEINGSQRAPKRTAVLGAAHDENAGFTAQMPRTLSPSGLR
jgi:hypothetical protein